MVRGTSVWPALMFRGGISDFWCHLVRDIGALEISCNKWMSWKKRSIVFEMPGFDLNVSDKFMVGKF